jgi:hypothetical protein
MVSGSAPAVVDYEALDLAESFRYHGDTLGAHGALAEAAEDYRWAAHFKALALGKVPTS